MASTPDTTIIEINPLQQHLLTSSDADNGPILYRASFVETEENFVKYQTIQWVLYSLLLILAWGIGLFMLLYLPVRRYILRCDIRSRKLYVTPTCIVYQVTRPVPFPCFGVLKKEKYVLLPSVADIVIEQGYLQSLFGVYSVRIESAGVRRPPSDDVQIQGIANPLAFRKAVLTHLANVKFEAFSGQACVNDAAVKDVRPRTAWMTPSKSSKLDALSPNESMLLQKIEEVETSVKRVQALIEDQQT